MIAAEKIKKRERDASLRDLWRTPQWLFVAIQRYIGAKFDVDVACNKDNALLPNFIGVERDALKCSWGEPGTVAFLNPPYSKITLDRRSHPRAGAWSDDGHADTTIPRYAVVRACG